MNRSAIETFALLTLLLVGGAAATRVLAQAAPSPTRPESDPGTTIMVQVDDPAAALRYLLNDQIVRAQGNVNLRDGPPAGVFKSLGRREDIVSEGEYVRIVEKKNVRTLFGSYDWARIERACPAEAGCKSDSGWVYLGKTSDGRLHFQPITEDQIKADIIDDPSSYLRAYLPQVEGAGAIVGSLDESMRKREG